MLKRPRQIRKKVLRPSRLARNGLAVRLTALATQIGRHHPRGFVIADPHAAGDVGQDHVGDRGVEHLHEGGDRDDDCDHPGVDCLVCGGTRGVSASEVVDGDAHSRPLSNSK